VLNIEDFPGTVEVSGCSFTRNMHFIPEILITPFESGLARNSDVFRD
jgi:hypothetical protein